MIGDLRQECSKHGVVVDVKVPRPPPGQTAQLMGTEQYGKVSMKRQGLGCLCMHAGCRVNLMVMQNC